MNQRLISDIGKSLRLGIVNRIKRTQGMSVGELSAAFGMSYMGVKQHCLDLEKRGYLDTFRRPKAPGQTGRPEITYRLTQKAHELFPDSGNEIAMELLESARSLFGAAAAEKLLFLTFQQKAGRYLSRIKGESLEERAKWFARVRDGEGCMAELESVNGEMRIIEHHSPIAGLLAGYPALIARLEQDLFAQVLKTPVVREQITCSGLYCCSFQIGAAGIAKTTSFIL